MAKKISIVAGGAGFIGCSLITELIRDGAYVVVIDNLSRGCREHISQFLTSNQACFINADLSNSLDCQLAFHEAALIGQINEVWHLAANSDIPAGVENCDVDLKDTFLSTVEILRSMKFFNIDTLFFASSSAVYGDLGSQDLREDAGPLLPISNYGAMKLASEALISAATESYLKKTFIFRFPNVVGFPATHGVIYDFVHKLISDPDILTVLGNGTQQKSYLHVSDLVSAMLKIRELNFQSGIELINIGPVDSGVTVKWIAERVAERVSPNAKIFYGDGDRGWVGDVPKFTYSTSKLQSYGWSPELGSKEAIIRAVDEIASQFYK
jgi:UDP-glucose 4-epimerase